MNVTPDPKAGKRIVDPAVVRATLHRFNWCAACGGPASNAHHVIQKGSPHFGDDLPGNIMGLCGTGTMRCHGAMHGSPYLEKVTDTRTSAGVWEERRDQAWVAERIGRDMINNRLDVIDYVVWKLGEVSGWDYLKRTYLLDLCSVRCASESPRP